MQNEKKGSKLNQFVRGLCEGKTEEEIQEAVENFEEYLLVVKGICDRLESEGKSVLGFD